MKLSIKIGLLFSTIAVTVMAVVIGITYMLIQNNIRLQENARQATIINQVDEQIKRHIEGRQAVIEKFSQASQLIAYTKKPTPPTSEPVYQLMQTVNGSGYWKNIAVLDLNEHTLTSLDSKQAAPANVLHENAAIKDLYTSAKQGKSGYSDALISSASHDTTLALVHPILDGEKVIGVVIGELAWGPIESIVKHIAGSDVYVVSREGNVIASNNSKSAQGTNIGESELFKAVQSRDSDAIISTGIGSGDRHLVSYVTEHSDAPYKGNGWRVIAQTPSNKAFAPARQLALEIGGMIFVLGGFVTAAIIFWINRRLVGPLRALTNAVSRIALGDLSQTLDATSHDEIGTLSRNFNEMTRQLAATHRGLQDASQEAKEKHAQLESSINGLRQGFVLMNKDADIIMANTAARMVLEEVHAASANEITLKQFIDVLPADLDLLKNIKHTLKTRKQTKFPVIPLGGHFLNVYLSPVVNGEDAIGCVLLLEDVTEERILQRSRDEFFSIASHELRTPLTAIRGNAKIMQEYYAEVTKNPDLSEMVSDIHDSSVRLIEIVNDFLDASRLEQNKMNFDMAAFSIEKIVEKIIYELGSLSRDKKISLIFKDPTLGKLPLVYSDKDRIKQILYNLIGNGMKFTEKGSVTVSTHVEGKMLKISVTDTGPGISAEGQQLLFHKFQQTGDSLLTRDNTRGTGLGLYISKLLLERMGGTIELEHSEPGKGSTFSFTIPLATNEQIAQTSTLQSDNKANHEAAKKSDKDVHSKIMFTPSHSD